MTSFSSLSKNALISPAELDELLSSQGDKVRVLDASYAIGAGGLSPETVFQQMRIKSAQFFDIDAVADQQTHLPHMLPSADEFAAAVSALGISNDHLVVVYDQSGIAMAACRAWWMFRTFGHNNVCVLDGGMPAWQRAGLNFENGEPAMPAPAVFEAHFRPELVTSYADMKQFVEAGERIILDARPPERFAGLSPEPRAGLEAGHMPGARSLPAGSLIDPQTRGMIDAETLSQRLDSLHLPPETPIVTTCGSGVTACVISLALFKKGYVNTSVYDGSWTEWGQQELHSPIVKGFE